MITFLETLGLMFGLMVVFYMGLLLLPLFIGAFLIDTMLQKLRDRKNKKEKEKENNETD